MEDSDFEQVLENADAVARRVYRDEAKAIEELRRGIVEVSGKEPPYTISSSATRRPPRTVSAPWTASSRRMCTMP